MFITFEKHKNSTNLAGQIISTYLLPLVISLIMFNLGLSLNFKNFKHTFRRPKALFVGLFCQTFLLPLIAFLIAWFSNLSPEFKIGIFLIAICPSGATSNLITYLLKGNVALSIALTSINSLLILLTIPFAIYVGVNYFAAQSALITLPFLDTVINVFFMIILPVIAGMLFKHWNESKAIKTERVLKYVSIILLIFVFGFAILLNKNGDKSLLDYYWEVTPFVLVLNILGMLVGFGAGKLFKFSKATLITLPVEVGIQNSTLAITLAISASFLNSPLMSVPATVYGMFTFFTALIFGYLVKRFVKE